MYEFPQPTIAFTEIVEYPQWVCFDKDKAPINHKTGKHASSKDPATWGTFDQASDEAVKNKNVKGTGFVFTKDDPFVGIDLDKCFDDDGTLQPWAKEIADKFQSYTEKSPSGRGLHILIKGKTPEPGRKKSQLECYSSGRYFTFTGRPYGDYPESIEPSQKELDEFWEKHFKAGSSGNGNGQHKININPNDAEFPEKKFQALCENNQRFKDTFEHNREDLEDQSLSTYDQSLVNTASKAGWKDSELAGLIIHHRQAHGDHNDVKKGYRRDYLERTIGKARESKKTTSLKRFPLTDAGNSERFIDQHGGDVCYSHEFGKWLGWNGKCWVVDTEGKIMTLAIRTARSVFDDLKYTSDTAEQKRIASHAIHSQNKGRLTAMLEVAQHMRSVSTKDLDSDPWKLNVENGTIDLRTGELSPHKREDLITKLVETEYDPEAVCPTWDRFLDDIMGENQGLISFLQKVVGYALTGDCSEQCFFIFHGSGSNGKSTFIETIHALLKGYSQKAEMRSFLVRNNEGANNDLASLCGARFVSAIETGRGKYLNESLIKELTGGDTITARFLYREYFQFTPTFKIFLAVNTKPEVNGSDHGIWRRIKLVPFGVRIEKEDIDKNLPQKLRRELPGVLAWAVHGCREWQKHGLREPAEVCEATESYRQEMDHLEIFLDDRCETAESLGLEIDEIFVTAQELFAAFSEWGRDFGLQKASKRKFSVIMGERGFKTVQRKVKGTNAKGYNGLRLKTPLGM